MREANSNFKSLKGNLLIREIPQDFIPNKVLTSSSTVSKKKVPLTGISFVYYLTL